MPNNSGDPYRQTTNYILVNEFTEGGVREFKDSFEVLMNTNQPIIPVYIDSFGGEIYSLLAMLDIIESSDRPVATIGLGKAMSCGSVLLASGTKGLRFIGRNSTVMIHDAAAFSFGKIEEIKADVNEAERLNEIIYRILDTKCKQKSGYFKKLVEQKKHANWFLSPDEAHKHRLIDNIGIPTLNFTYSFDLQEYKETGTKKTKKPKKTPVKRKLPSKKK